MRHVAWSTSRKKRRLTTAVCTLAFGLLAESAVHAWWGAVQKKGTVLGV